RMKALSYTVAPLGVALLVTALVASSGCSHSDCAVDLDCPSGQVCFARQCLLGPADASVGQSDAAIADAPSSPADAAPSDAAPAAGRAEAGARDRGLAKAAEPKEAGSPDADLPKDADVPDAMQPPDGGVPGPTYRLAVTRGGSYAIYDVLSGPPWSTNLLAQ